jgi:DNA-binding NtrC family response regulator
MMYGFYRMVKSDQKIPSGVRIICSSDRPLEILERDALIIKPLADQLKNVVGFLPFSVLTSAELGDLADGFVEQALMSQPFKNLLSLTDKDKTKLVNPLPKSLQEFKMKVQQLLVQKSKKNQVYEETVFDPAYAVSDPELIEAARLGKYALKDAKIMASLWHKFKNQNKIATFLGVNRSSINRRCKEYNLN